MHYFIDNLHLMLTYFFMAHVDIFKISQNIMPSVFNRDRRTIGQILKKYPLKVQNEVISLSWDRLLSMNDPSHFQWFVSNIELPFNAEYMRLLTLN